jgi:hypothetical protein
MPPGLATASAPCLRLPWPHTGNPAVGTSLAGTAGGISADQAGPASAYRIADQRRRRRWPFFSPRPSGAPPRRNRPALQPRPTAMPRSRHARAGPRRGCCPHDVADLDGGHRGPGRAARLQRRDHRVTASPGFFAPAPSPAHGHGRTSAPGWSPRPAAATYSHPRRAPAAHPRLAVTAAPPPSAAAGRCRSARGSPRHTVPRDRGRCSAASDGPASVFTGQSAHGTASARQVERQVRGRSAAASGATRTAQGSESITGCDLAAGGRAYGPGRLHRTS